MFNKKREILLLFWYYLIMQERSNRKKIDCNKYVFSFLINKNIQKQVKYISLNDISNEAISFKTDTKIDLNTEFDILAYSKESKVNITLKGFVSRVDEIIEINNPDKQYKIVVKFFDNSNILNKEFI